MILEVPSHAGKVLNHGNPVRPELIGRPDTRKQQQVRRSDRSGRQDHLARGLSGLTTGDVFDANGPATLENDSLTYAISEDGEIRPRLDRVEVSSGRAD